MANTMLDYVHYGAHLFDVMGIEIDWLVVRKFGEISVDNQRMEDWSPIQTIL